MRQQAEQPRSAGCTPALSCERPPCARNFPWSCRLFCDKGGQLRELALSSCLDHTLWAAAMVLSRAFHARVGGQQQPCKSSVGGPLGGLTSFSACLSCSTYLTRR